MRSAESITEKVNSLRPSPYKDYLGDYLEAIDLRVQKEILGKSDPAYNPLSLSLDTPYDTVYELFLFTVIDFLNGEFGRYENTYKAFSCAWEKLSEKYAQSDGNDQGDGGTNNDNTSTDTDSEESLRWRIKLW